MSAKSKSSVRRPSEYSELPELTDKDLARGVWKIGGKVVSNAEGKAAFRATLKKSRISITLDPDVIAWFKRKAGGRGYQTLINATLREAMLGQRLEKTLRRVIREEMRQ
jgi:uncharacterized protein (DUF4415 family)